MRKVLDRCNMAASVFIAMGIALVGTMTLNIGLVIQKSEANKLPIINFRNPKSFLYFLACGKWILGTFLTFIGWGAFFLAVTLAPVSLIAPLNNAGVLVLVLIAVSILRETISLFEWSGVILTILSVIIMGITAEQAQEAGSAFNPQLLVIFVFLSLLILILAYIVHILYLPTKYGILLSLTAGISTGLGAVFTKALSTTWDETLFFFNMNIYLLLIFQTISFITLQAAFQQERAIIVVPVTNSFGTLIPLIIGIFVFMETVSSLQVLGILGIIVGTSILFQFGDQTPTKSGE